MREAPGYPRLHTLLLDQRIEGLEIQHLNCIQKGRTRFEVRPVEVSVDGRPEIPAFVLEHSSENQARCVGRRKFSGQNCRLPPTTGLAGEHNLQLTVSCLIDPKLEHQP